MADVMAQQAISPSRKRSHEGFIVSHLTESNIPECPATELSANATTHQGSPAPSTAMSELTELTSSVASPSAKVAVGLNANLTTDETLTPSKKRKLTFAEREVEKAVKKHEKEEKERVKAEQKLLKEEEKRQKDEEKRQKEEEKEELKRAKDLEKAEKKKIDDAKRAEREEKKKAKDAEKQEKEVEKAKKEADKLKKERAQLRIAAFFAKPAQSSTPPSIPDDASMGVLSRRSSMTSIDMEESVVQPKQTATTNPEFEKYIIPYFVHDHTELAPTNRFQTTTAATAIDGHLNDNAPDVDPAVLEPIGQRFRTSQRRFRSCSRTVKEVVETTQPSTTDSSKQSELASLLHFIPLKFLSFREDVRPPYMGTYTTTISSPAARRMSRNPVFKGRPDTNYDYDSEAEWEPPAEDDDDINLDDEMSESEDEEDEMEDFLDDENDTAKRRLFVGEMEPVSSGLCWEGDVCTGATLSLKQYTMGVLHDSTKFPIDPYSTTHWIDETKPKAAPSKVEIKATSEAKDKPETATNSMPPPRLPLVPVNAPNSILSFATSVNSQTIVQNENAPSPVAKQRGRPANSNKELKMIQDEFLPAFKSAVNGSDLTKAGLIEILKKQFPKCSKDAIKDTLGVIAIRVGKKEVEKKWALV